MLLRDSWPVVELLTPPPRFQASGDGVKAIPHILAASAICEQYRLEGLRLSSTLLLADVQLEVLRSTERARELVVSSQLPIKQQGSLALQLRANILLAKICMASSTSQEGLIEAENLLLSAFSFAKRLEALQLQKQILYYLARVYHEMGDHEAERDEAASLFLQTTTPPAASSGNAKSAYFIYIDEISALLQ